MAPARRAKRLAVTSPRWRLVTNPRWRLATRSRPAPVTRPRRPKRRLKSPHPAQRPRRSPRSFHLHRSLLQPRGRDLFCCDERGRFGPDCTGKEGRWKQDAVPKPPLPGQGARELGVPCYCDRWMPRKTSTRVNSSATASWPTGFSITGVMELGSVFITGCFQSSTSNTRAPGSIRRLLIP